MKFFTARCLLQTLSAKKLCTNRRGKKY